MEPAAQSLEKNPVQNGPARLVKRTRQNEKPAFVTQDLRPAAFDEGVGDPDRPPTAIRYRLARTQRLAHPC